jgi:hypothetical protein
MASTVASAVSLGLAACGRTSGSSTPPASLGSLDKPLIGCPDIAGVYVWPPVDGHVFADDRRPHGFASRRVVGVNVYPYGRFGIRMAGRGSPLTAVFRERSPESDAPEPRLNGPGWGYHEWGAPEWRCSFGYLETDEVDFEAPTPLPGSGPSPHGAESAHGRRTSVLWRMTRLADGSLALGMREHITGGKQSLFSWGDQSAGTVTEADHDEWHWSRLEPVQDDELAKSP